MSSLEPFPQTFLISCIQLFQRVSLFFKTIKVHLVSKMLKLFKKNSQEKIDLRGESPADPSSENDFVGYKPRL